MTTNTRSIGRTVGVAVRSMVIITLVLGPLYCLVITGVGQLIFHGNANGSMVENNHGAVVGSTLIGQSFSDSKGNPLAQYFQPRPSAAGDGYDGAGSSGSNLGPENPELIKSIAQRRQQVATFNRVSRAQVPPDAVTASGSGLDPDISPAYAKIQEDRVARARQLPISTVQQLVQEHTSGRVLGFLGEPTVNVLELNLALDKLD
ncbi:potassium-transporting ATPase KdpC subunit [Microlunatus endophyticus]|uniref:Potassium-transporting ATPase KdpC subunit n=1 Tax=Microlunatus endophyticus TaxID=1716077 RepID=A0A917SCV6_9ACTN|nr:potassium-transporting ATPase subunit KdpC [Microlunatus endophyticus]GGL68734.1 potassium-transporting ATPase KdpC subunit [Microlunatus endophyticus]